MPYKVEDLDKGRMERGLEASVRLTARTYLIDLARSKGKPKESSHTEIF
jgi:hypothetical protein